MVYQSQEDSGLCPTLFVYANTVLNGTMSCPIDMETTIIDILMAIPSDATVATVQGVEMKMISTEQAESLLTNAKQYHECILQNGRFVFESNGGKLITLYKVLN